MKNLEFIKNQMTYLGFGDKSIAESFDKAMEEGHERFTLNVRPPLESTAGNRAQFELNFNKSSQNDMCFFNTFKTTLIDKDDNPLHSQTFHTNSTKGITAKESINLLEGRAIKTVLNYNGEDSKVYAKLNFEETNKYGNFKYKTFNENYGVDVKDIITKIEVKSGLKLDGSNLENFTKSLEKGNLIKTDFLVRGKEVSGYVSLNPEFKNIGHFDADLKIIFPARLGHTQKAVEKEESKVSISIDKRENQFPNTDPVVLAELSDIQNDKLRAFYQTGEGKLPSVSPKQMETVPYTVLGQELSNKQRRDLIFGDEIKLDQKTTILVELLGKKELNVIRESDDGKKDISTVQKSDVSYESQAKELKPFESAEQMPDKANAISR